MNICLFGNVLKTSFPDKDVQYKIKTCRDLAL